MRKAKALKDFKKKSDAELMKKSTGVAVGLTNNADFPEAGTMVIELEDLNQQFEIAMASTGSRDRIKIQQKNTLRKQLIEELERIVDYVNYKANGDRAKILGAGLSCSTVSATPSVLGAVNNFKVILGKNSGEIIVSADRVKGAKFYEFCYVLTPVQGNNWQYKNNNKRRQDIAGLQRGKEYDVCMSAVDNNSVRVTSDIISILVV